MKNSFWIVMIVLAGFLGILMGYSVPPLVEVGMIGGKGEEVGVKSELDQEMDDYYRNLLDETGEAEPEAS